MSLNPLRPLDRLFFQDISGTGFGLMRMAWGTVIALSMLAMWPDVLAFFSNQGVLPTSFLPDAVRSMWRWSFLDTVTAPHAVSVVWWIFFVSACFTAIGLWPRLSLITTFVLLCSFHERNPFVFAGGDTLLRLIGFILIVSPSVSAFSVSRLRKQISTFSKTQALLPPVRVSSYAYRLLLWQVMIVYTMSLWEKLNGSLWRYGTAIEVVFHHPMFSRFPTFVNWLTPITPLATWSVLLFHSLWPLQLIPRVIIRIPFKRIAMFLGLFFHGGILLFLDAGNFSLVIFTAYLGLLIDEDFTFFRKLMNRKWKGTIAVFYDGKCLLCRRVMAFLLLCDWNKRLYPANLHDPKKRIIAPDLKLSDLKQEIHIRMPNRKTVKGFAAFREICEHLPLLWPLVPVLWLPGMDFLGNAAYRYLASRRLKCMQPNCTNERIA